MTTELQPIKPGRLLSLDVFRGMTIAGMILVNNPGDWGNMFAPLKHAAWHGVTPTDLIFPFFLFIMGTAMAFSFSRRQMEGADTSALLFQIGKRTAILFGLGLMLGLILLQAAPWVEHLRILGVLQRIALCYLAVALIVLFFGIRMQAAIMGGILLLYYILMRWVPVPGIGAGLLDSPGTNLAGYIDHHLLGKHAYQLHKESGMYWDPEGLLSTIPAIATTLSGLLTGHWLRSQSRDGNEKAAGMALAGIASLILASLWAYDFPYNKALWTSSFVLYCTGWGLLCFSAIYWLLDVKLLRGWEKPFTIYGTNAIAAYVGASATALLTIWIKIPQEEGDPIFLKTWLYKNLFKSWIEPLAGAKFSSMSYSLAYIFLWLFLMWILYRKKIFIKV